MPNPDPQAIPAAILARAARVKLALFDVDGVLTDGRLLYSDDGRELKAFHVHDGLGLKRLIANGIEVGIITTRMSHMVTERTAELGIAHVYQGQGDKAACFEQLIHALKLQPEQSSLVSARAEVTKFWTIGAAIAPGAFVGRPTAYPISDDHTALQSAGIPSFLVIDFDYEPYFNTTQDTIDKCSVDSLQTVGRTLLQYLYAP